MNTPNLHSCSEEKGGTACYLRSYPQGYGLPFDPHRPDGKADYIALDFMLNDLRKFPAPPMVFYEEIALKWSAREDLTPMSTSTMHMSSGRGHPFSTTLATRRPGFLWSTSRWLVDGKLVVSQQDLFPWFHAHRKFMQVGYTNTPMCTPPLSRHTQRSENTDSSLCLCLCV